MPTTIESSGKTLDEAIRSGLSVLGVEREAVTVEILSKGKTGIFGIGSTLAKVKLTLATTEKSVAFEGRSPAGQSGGQTHRAPQKSAQYQGRSPAGQGGGSRPTQPQGGGRTPPGRAPSPAQAGGQYEQQQKARAERAPKRATIPATDEDYKKANDFITDLLKHFDMGMNVSAEVKDGVIQINMDGEHVGNLIGRHGETLDAIQHIVTNVVNLKNDGVTVRVQVDAADYRSKRQSALEQLARRMAENAKKYNSNMTLEPMNAYERHVIHVTLQDMPGIATFSTGSEPQRRVIISSTSAPRRRPSNNDRRPPRDNNRSRPPRSSTPTGGGSVPQPPHSPAGQPAPVPPPRSLPVKEFGIKKK